MRRLNGRLCLLLFLATLITAGCGKRTTNISGGAWVTVGGGESHIQRGLEVMLCQGESNLLEEIGNFRKEEKQQIKETNEQAHSTLMNAMLNGEGSAGEYLRKYYISAHQSLRSNIESGRLATIPAKYKISSIQTNIDGKYTFTNIPSGKYYLFAQFVSSFSVGYWLVPMTIPKRPPAITSLDLDNTRMVEFYNKETWEQ